MRCVIEIEKGIKEFKVVFGQFHTHLPPFLIKHILPHVVLAVHTNALVQMPSG